MGIEPGAQKRAAKGVSGDGAEGLCGDQGDMRMTISQRKAESPNCTAKSKEKSRSGMRGGGGKRGKYIDPRSWGGRMWDRIGTGTTTRGS